MERSRFDLLLQIQSELRSECEQMIERYRELRKQILPDHRDQIHPGLRFRKIEWAYISPEPELDAWEIEYNRDVLGIEPKTEAERQAEKIDQSTIKFGLDLGYEYVYEDLPLAWLLDPNWEETAKAKLIAEAKEHSEFLHQEALRQRERDLIEMERLKARLGKV